MNFLLVTDKKHKYDTEPFQLRYIAFSELSWT